METFSEKINKMVDNLIEVAQNVTATYEAGYSDVQFKNADKRLEKAKRKLLEEIFRELGNRENRYG